MIDKEVLKEVTDLHKLMMDKYAGHQDAAAFLVIAYYLGLTAKHEESRKIVIKKPKGE